MEKRSNEEPKVPSYEEAMKASYPFPMPSSMGQMAQPQPMQQSYPMPPYHMQQSYPIYQVNPPQVLVQPQVQIATPQNVTVTGVGPRPARLTCPSCHAMIETDLKHTPNTKTHLAALLLCLLGCACCAWCPYCIDDCQNTDHMCPNCGTYIGTYQT